ncbi:MAG: hypothetical protein U9R31_00955 [Candidatus Omnitrophota bacterium]|nr:hypothetical protein [Candidatus Omnitrophota bacterium]
MIKLDLITVISIYQFILVAGILVIWIIAGYIKKEKVVDKAGSANMVMRQCPVCTHIYRVDKGQELTKCPSCKSYNK